MKSLTNVSVLIVDDDPDLRVLVAEDFENEGARVKQAEDGISALEIIKKENFDLVISDMRMPNGDGRFLAGELLKVEGDKPLLFLYSGYNDISESKMHELGISHIFPKPIAMAEMLEVILKKMSAA